MRDAMTSARRTHRTQAERRAETERRVLEATMTIIAEHGVHAVTAASVGEAAGYSPGQRDQSIRADLHPAATATAIVGQLRGIALQLPLAPDLIELDTLLTQGRAAHRHGPPTS
jgi:hypothetical protein